MAGKQSSPRKKKAFKREAPDIYQQVTDQIIEALETTGKLPWQPAEDGLDMPVSICTPYNAVTGRPYRGINHLMMVGAALRMSDGALDSRFCTFNQAKEKGWNVKKGSKGIPVFFYKKIAVASAGDEDKERQMARDAMRGYGNRQNDRDRAEGRVAGRSIWILRAFTVFHASQIEGIPALSSERPAWDVNQVAMQMLEGLKATGMKFLSGSNRNAYSPDLDALLMQEPVEFASAESYASNLLHEMGHATGSESRLNRDSMHSDDPAMYAKEELVAEMTSAMLCGQLGIASSIQGHADYVKHWVDLLRGDKKLIVRAAGQAAVAADYLVEMVPELRAQIAAHRKGQEELAEVDLSDIFADADKDLGRQFSGATFDESEFVTDEELGSDISLDEADLGGADFAGPEDGDSSAHFDESEFGDGDSVSLDDAPEQFSDSVSLDAFDDAVPTADQVEAQSYAPIQEDGTIDLGAWFDEFVEEAPPPIPVKRIGASMGM